MLYDLIVDELIKVWTRSKVVIEADSEGEATMKLLYGGSSIAQDIYNTEYLDCEEYIEKSTEDPVTIEIRNTSGDLIVNNA